MSGFIDGIKNKWNQPDNGLIKLIMINVAVFIIMVLLKVILQISIPSNSNSIYNEFIYNNVAIPSAIDSFLFKPWTIITYFFTHSLDPIFHIIFNMLMLYWFGQIIVEFIGSKKLVALYVLGGIAAGLIYLLMYNLVPYYSSNKAYMVGASGSIFAIIVGAAVLTPDYKLFLLFIGSVKMKYIAGIAIFISFLGTTGDNAGGNLAHLGGGLFGYLFIYQLRNGRDWSIPVTSTLDYFASIFKPKPQIKITYKREVYQEVSSVKSTVSNKKFSDNPDQEMIDAILDKISESGYEKLTTEEKEILFKASQKKS